MSSYYYLSEKAAYPYTVAVKPPPADDSRAIVHRGTPEGDEVYSQDLEPRGQGTFTLDMEKVTVPDSPLFIEFSFKKDDQEKKTVRAVVLAEPQPAKIKAPKSAGRGDTVTLEVTSWVALAHEKPGEDPKVVKETSPKRIGSLADEVCWQVDGEDLDARGAKIELAIEEKHLGKALAIEAYLGDEPLGHGKVTLPVYELASLEPDDSPKDPTRFFVNLPSNEAEQTGRTITITATVAPVAAGVPVYFSLDHVFSREKYEPEQLVAGIAAGLSKTQVTTDKNGVAKTTLRLSTYGGDRYRVIASVKKDAEPVSQDTLQTRWFEVWRRLDFELDCMQRPSGGTYKDRAPVAELKKRFQAVQIDLNPVGEDDEPALVRKISFAEGRAWAKKLQQSTGKSLFQLVYIYAAVHTSKTQTVELDLTSPPYLWPLEMNLWCLDPADWFVSATYRQGSKRGSFAKPTLECDDRNITYAVTFDMPASLAPSIDDPVKVVLKLKNWVELGGFQDGQSTVIGCRWAEVRKRLAADDENHLTEEDVKNAILGTTLHEPGHGFGLAAATRPQAPPSKNPNTYSKNGYHCHENGDTCAMYETIPHTSPVPEPAFCSTCTDALRARNLSTLPVYGASPF